MSEAPGGSSAAVRIARSIALLGRSEPGSRRIIWVDNAKALLIVMVVLGHFRGTGPVKYFLYGFHVPAFLFATGFLLPLSLQQVPSAVFFRKNILPIIRVTIFWILVSVLIWFLTMRHGGGPSVIEALGNGFYGTRTLETPLIHKNGPIWYLPFFVSSLAALFIMLRFPAKVQPFIVLAYLLFSLFYHGPRLPWSLDVAGVGLFFIYAGHMLRRWSQRETMPAAVGSPSLWWLLPLTALLAVLSAVVTHYNGRANINVMIFGHNMLLFLIAAFAGIGAVIALSLSLPDTALARMLARGTLFIFCTHIYLVRVLGTAVRHHFSNDWRLVLAIAIAPAIAIACGLLATALTPLIERYVMGRPARKGS